MAADLLKAVFGIHTDTDTNEKDDHRAFTDLPIETTKAIVEKIAREFCPVAKDIYAVQYDFEWKDAEDTKDQKKMTSLRIAEQLSKAGYIFTLTEGKKVVFGALDCQHAPDICTMQSTAKDAAGLRSGFEALIALCHRINAFMDKEY